MAKTVFFSLMCAVSKTLFFLCENISSAFHWAYLSVFVFTTHFNWSLFSHLSCFFRLIYILFYQIIVGWFYSCVVYHSKKGISGHQKLHLFMLLAWINNMHSSFKLTIEFNFMWMWKMFGNSFSQFILGHSYL